MLCPVGDSSSFAVQIVRLLSEPQLARKCALAGETWVRENCDSDFYSERFHALLQNLSSLTKKDGIRNRLDESHPAQVKSS